MPSNRSPVHPWGTPVLLDLPRPRSVPRGFYCLNGSALECPQGSYCPSSGLSSPIPCTVPGYECPRGSLSQESNMCPNTGGYCLNGTFLPCPAGRYCPDSGMSHAGPWCPVGFMCPEGSAVPSSCPAGQFCNITGLAQVSRVFKLGTLCVQEGLPSPWDVPRGTIVPPQSPRRCCVPPCRIARGTPRAPLRVPVARRWG